MANEDSTAQETTTHKIDQCNSHNIMYELWERTSHTLTDKDLEWFSGATEHAEYELASLNRAIVSIGCLALNDAALERGKQAGNFQIDSGDTPDLLFSIANSLSAIQGLIHVGSSADDRLKNPERYQKSNEIKAVK